MPLSTCRTTLSISLLLLAAAVPAASQEAPGSREFLVNTATADYQIDPAVAEDAAGNFVVVWASEGMDARGELAPLSAGGCERPGSLLAVDLEALETMPAENENQEPRAWMEHRLLAWLSGSGPRSAQLERWLQGYDLPVLAAEEEPYVWLLRGLPQEDRYRWESRMAAEVAELVGQQPDVEPRGRRPQRLLYNLLMLAAGLSSPDELGERLWQMYERRSLAGDWLGSDLCDALRSALAENQLDDRLAPLWESMLRGRTNGFVSGSELDGMDGVVLMPRSARERGAPHFEAIGGGLARLAAVLEDDPRRERTLERLLRRLSGLYPSSGTLERRIVATARRAGCAGWALPHLTRWGPDRSRAHGSRPWSKASRPPARAARSV